MTQVHLFQIQEENGEIYTIYAATKDDTDIPEVPDDTERDSDREEYGFDTQETLVQMVEVHKAIRAYTRYAIGAFKNFSDEHIEEVTLKFGLKIGGKTGIPFIAEASSEGNFEIEVKCKFPESATKSSS